MRFATGKCICRGNAVTVTRLGFQHVGCYRVTADLQKRKDTMKRTKDVERANSQLPLSKPNETPRSTVKRIDPHTVEVAIVGSLDEMLSDLCTPTGTRRDEVAVRIIEQVCSSLQPRPRDTDQRLIQGISSIAEMAPQSLTEAMLSAQMIATHEAAMGFILSATREDQTFQGRDANVLRATRLMRLHLDQIEALQKLKGKAGQQKMTVEHVHVHAGGQAIVGPVDAGKPKTGGGDERTNRR